MDGTKQIIDLVLLVKLMALALGSSMFFGNVFGLIQHKRGKTPKGESGGLQRGRNYWLMAVGLLVGVWGGASIVA